MNLELCRIIDNITDYSAPVGTFHYFANTVTKHDILTAINKVYDLKQDIIKVTKPVENKTLATRWREADSPVLSSLWMDDETIWPTLEHRIEELKNFEL